MADSRCIADWPLGELAAHARAASAEESAHLASCSRCAQRHARLQDEIQEAQRQAVPASVLAALRPEPPTPWRQRLAWLLAVPAMASLLWVSLVASPVATPATRSKGRAEWVATVQRADRTVEVGVPLALLKGLREGDHLEVQLVGARDAWVVVQGWGDTDWETYYAGPAPQDGRLPVGLGITTDGQTRLRLALCASAPRAADLSACEVHLYDL